MINGDTNWQLLHGANSLQNRENSSNDDGLEGTTTDHQVGEQEPDQEHDSRPVASMLPRGLEYETLPSSGLGDSLLDDNELVDGVGNLIENGDDHDHEYSSEQRTKYAANECKLSFFFVIMVLAGVGNILAAKLQAVCMYNYGVFLSLFSYVIYLPLCFAFIIPVSRFGWFDNAITEQHWALPKRPFAIMGFLDCLAAVMQTFASLYLPGSLLVLLPQASIPLSILLSRHMLHERYGTAQYIGAAIVFLGLVMVLEPVATFRHEPDYVCEAFDVENNCTACNVATTENDCLEIVETVTGFWRDKGQDIVAFTTPNPFLEIFSLSTARELATPVLESDIQLLQPNGAALCEWKPLAEASTGKEGFSIFIWSIVMILSCIPMTLSSVYKQIVLRSHSDLHPVFLISWIGVFQFLFSIVSAPSVGWATGIPIGELHQNLWNGLRCYFGMSSLGSGCHPDLYCSSGHAFLFVNLCLLCQAIYMVSLIFVLKYGSMPLLYLALTMMVALAHLSFSLWSSTYPSDFIALLAIVLGLLLYRFGNKIPRRLPSSTREVVSAIPAAEHDETASTTTAERCHPMLEPLISYAYV